jgi:hypothetical protein
VAEVEALPPSLPAWARAAAVERAAGHGLSQSAVRPPPQPQNSAWWPSPLPPPVWAPPRPDPPTGPAGAAACTTAWEERRVSEWGAWIATARTKVV